MNNLLVRLSHIFAQILFSIITPFLLIPWIAQLSITRLFVAFCFGRLYGNRYQKIIDSFQGRYSLPMAKGLAKAKEIAGDKISVALDCGTGTGFVTKQAAFEFPYTNFIAVDILHAMLKQAQENCKDIATPVFHVQADSFALPFADRSVDLLLIQNTIPCFLEFARVCRPGGTIIYVDTSAGWITNLAIWLVDRQKIFETVMGEQVDLGFYVLAKKSVGFPTAVHQNN
jgi:SAM-dependent methyltransferase